MAYPLSMSDHTPPMLHCSLLIPKAGRFAKVGIADTKNFGFLLWGLARRRNTAMIMVRHGKAAIKVAGTAVPF
jgi:hypothetical protein